MPNIDTSTIEGFDSMTAEQKVEALLKVEVPERVDMSKYVSKETADKYASEAADYKRQLSAKMSDDELAAQKAAAEREKLQNDYQELLRKATVAEHTSRYIALGYESTLARETAEALFDGDMEKVFQNHQKFNEAKEKAIKAENMRNNPRPDGAGDNKSAEDKNIAQAKAMGKAKADALKASRSALDKFKV